MYIEPQQLNQNNNLNNHDIILPERVNQLLFQSIATLEEILNNQQLPAQERANVALKILEMTGLLSQQNYQPPATLISNAQQELNQVQINNVGLPKPQVKSNFLTADYVEIQNFFSSAENQSFLDKAIEQREQYTESTTTTKADKYRQSYVLFAKFFPELSALIQSKILETLPEVLTKLNMPPFEISEIEVQLTAHNDGCYYKIHNDAGSEKTATRELTYVYYFYQEPKAFSGGELRIYDTELKGRGVITHENYKTIRPANNSIVFFQSRLRHEVMPVVCPSKLFDHSRFTVNGWIRRLVK